jgi:hypothetical protein
MALLNKQPREDDKGKEAQDQKPFQTFQVRDSDLRRFLDCQHIGVRDRINFRDKFYTGCARCIALRDTAKFTTLILQGDVRVEVDDEHPYYGPHTIMRIFCTRCTAHHLECTCESTRVNPGPKCKRGRVNAFKCMQYYYTTLRDFKFFADDGRAHIDCRQAHASPDFPIYKCLMAMDAVLGLRFDFPIPVQDGLRAGYNPTLNAAIICDNNSERMEATMRSAFTKVSPKICVIAPARVNTYWAGTIPENRLNPFDNEATARGIAVLAMHIAVSLGILDPSDSAVPPGFEFGEEKFTALVKKIAIGRIIMKTNDIDDSQAPVPSHDIDRSQFMMGTSGSQGIVGRYATETSEAHKLFLDMRAARGVNPPPVAH